MKKSFRLSIAFAFGLLITVLIGMAIKSPTSVSSEKVQEPQPISFNTVRKSFEGIDSKQNDDLTNLRRCLPDEAVNIAKLGEQEAVEEAGGVSHELTYHLFEYTVDGNLEASVVLEHGSLCGLAHFTGMNMALSEAMPIEVARSLQLQSYQDVIDTQGFEVLEEALMNLQPTVDGELEEFSPESIWALAQLGIYPPEGTYKVRKTEPYVPGRYSSILTED